MATTPTIDEVVVADPGRPDFCARCATPLDQRLHGGRLRPTCPRCDWVYFAKNATGAAIGVERDGSLLLVRRRHDPYRGWWMLPAGFVEYGESAEQTAVREALEETGLAVQLTGLWGVYFGTDDPRNVAHLIVYGAAAGEGTPAAGDDAIEVSFFPAQHLPDQIAFAGHRAAIRDWLQRRGIPTGAPDH